MVLEHKTKLELQQMQMVIHRQVQQVMVQLEVLVKEQVQVLMEMVTQGHQDQDFLTLLETLMLLEMEEVAQALLLLVQVLVVMEEHRLLHPMVDQQTVVVKDQGQAQQAPQVHQLPHQEAVLALHLPLALDVQVVAL